MHSAVASDYDVSFWQIMETVEVNRSRVLKDFQNPLEIFGPKEFRARYRFTKEGAIALFDIIKNNSSLHRRAHAIPANASNAYSTKVLCNRTSSNDR